MNALKMFVFGVIAVMTVIVVSGISAMVSHFLRKTAHLESIGHYGRLSNTDVSISGIEKYLKLTNGLES